MADWGFYSWAAWGGNTCTFVHPGVGASLGRARESEGMVTGVCGPALAP